MSNRSFRLPILTREHHQLLNAGGQAAVEYVQRLLQEQNNAHRATRRRWRQSYKRTLRKRTEEIATQAREQTAKGLQNEHDRATARIKVAEDRMSALAAEVTRVRLITTHKKLSRRWMLTVQFDETFMQYARDLKTAGGVIVYQLTNEMIRSMHMLDFSRMKPIDFDAERHPIYEMKFFEEGKDPWKSGS